MAKTKKTAQPITKSVTNNNILPQMKWGESYTSLFLGIVVVVVAAILVFSFLKGKNFYRTTSTGSTSTNQDQTAKMLPKIYQVKAGDNLWSISEQVYGSGYNWVDVAKINNLVNPNILYVGAKLSIPDVKPRMVKNETPQVTGSESVKSITGVTYTVEKGDYLWVIAVRAYGDGYKWVEIAKANNLVNPDLIYSGNVLKLPR